MELVSSQLRYHRVRGVRRRRGAHRIDRCRHRCELGTALSHGTEDPDATRRMRSGRGHSRYFQGPHCRVSVCHRSADARPDHDLRTAATDRIGNGCHHVLHLFRH